MTEVYEAYKYLYHYTNYKGLKGILETQTLWATHYKGLNDTSEIKHLHSQMEEILHNHIRDIIRKDMKRGYHRKRFWEKLGGITKIARSEAKRLTDVFYETTFTGMPNAVPFAEPYVLSFCSHNDHGDYVRKNGLLSQWRAYGEKGGYALIFDTKHLLGCLKLEHQAHYYSGLNFGDVVYDGQIDKFETEFAGLFAALGEWVHAFASQNNEPPSADVFTPFLNAATRFKHRGFQEESEVRIIAVPISEALKKIAKDPSPLKIKPTPIRKMGEAQVQYIVLNDVPKKKPLPIVQIIVGPQPDQQKCAEEVKRLVGKKDIKITCSETPYLPVR